MFPILLFSPYTLQEDGLNISYSVVYESYEGHKHWEGLEKRKTAFNIYILMQIPIYNYNL